MNMRKRILIVDDDEQVLFVLHRILARTDSEYEIVTARNGQEALKNAGEMMVDLLITDLRMPDMGGVALTKAIRDLNAGTVIIWMTAYGCNLSRADAARLGVYRCLDKPVEIAEIRQVVRKALEATRHGASVPSSNQRASGLSDTDLEE
jgi:two-component system response regulator PilR (NtrC family)